MKQILYIPTGEIATMLTGYKDENDDYISTSAGEYITSGRFKSEFERYSFFDQTKDLFDLFIAFACGEIKEDNELIFGDSFYDRLNIDDDHQDKVTRAEFEVIEVA